jgi:propanediol dehydratase small subunit
MTDTALTAADYPLSVRRPDLLTTPTGKPYSAITLDGVMSGEVKAEDLRTTPETLRMQAELSEAAGRPQLGANLRRAAELTSVDDDRVLEIYNALRPNASTKQQLLDIATDLEEQHAATVTAAFVREAAEVYERRGVLADED